MFLRGSICQANVELTYLFNQYVYYIVGDKSCYTCTLNTRHKQITQNKHNKIFVNY